MLAFLSYFHTVPTNLFLFFFSVFSSFLLLRLGKFWLISVIHCFYPLLLTPGSTCSVGLAGLSLISAIWPGSHPGPCTGRLWPQGCKAFPFNPCIVQFHDFMWVFFITWILFAEYFFCCCCCLFLWKTHICLVKHFYKAALKRFGWIISAFTDGLS